MNTLSNLLTANIPTYTTSIPSTNEKTNFRPFLVKEEKILLLAQGTGNNSEVLNAIKNILEVCFDGIDDASSMPLFDVEYLFLKLRSKSVSEKVNPKIICPFTEEEIELDINLDEIEIKGELANTTVDISDTVKLKLKYPTLRTLMNQSEGIDYNDPSSLYSLVVSCIEKIMTKEETIDATQVSLEEISSFVDSMTRTQFEKVLDFFLDSPRVEKKVPYTTSDGTVREVVLSGLSDFFG